MKLSKKTLSYTAYFIGVTVFFLYFLFPSDAVKDYVIYKINLAVPGVSVTIDRVSPILPPGIKLHDIGIAHGGRALIDIDNVKLTPGLLAFFSSKKTARFTGRVSAGTLDGWAQTDSRGGQRAELIEATFSGIQVQKIPALKQLTAHKIFGSLGGDLKLAGTGPSRSVTGKLSLTESRIEFDQSVFGQSSLEFRNIDADLVLNRGTLFIKSCRARGSQLDADISGSIAMNRMGRSKALNLKGSVTPHHGLLTRLGKSLPGALLQQQRAGKTAIAFTIGGSMQSPEFRLD